jgi:hypothetical protein
MNSINKYQSLIIGLSVIVGLLIGQSTYLTTKYAEHFIVPFLMIMFLDFS